MKISLPDKLDLKCKNCMKTFQVSSQDIDGVPVLGCPYCSTTSPVYDLLAPQLRRTVYFKARRQIELLAQNYQKPPSG